MSIPVATWLLVIFASPATGPILADAVQFNTESACIVARQVVLSSIRDSGRTMIDFDAFCVNEGDPAHEPKEPENGTHSQD